MALLFTLMRNKYCVALLFAVLAGAALWRDGYVRGQRVVQSAWDSEQARTAAGIIKNMEVERARNDLAAQSREADRSRQRSTFREIRRQVVRAHDGDADCGLSDAGLRTWNDANANATADLSGQPDGEVSEPADGE